MTSPENKQEDEPSAIMFVDDEAGIRRSFAREMHESRLEIQLASGVEEAMALAEAKHYPVVVTDLHMPDGGGVRLIEQLRSLSPNTRYVVVTGAPELIPEAEAVTPHATEVIQKPWSRDALADAIARALSAYRGQKVYAEQAQIERESQRPSAPHSQPPEDD